MNRIKDLRIEKHKTQKDIAKFLNITEQALSYYERGLREPKLETWQALAKYFNVPVPYLQGLGVSRSEAINDIVDKVIDENERDVYFSSFTGIEHNLQEKITRSDVNYINSTWGSGLSSPNKFVKNLIDNNNRQALGYLVGKYLPLVNDYNFLVSVPNNVDAYYKALEKRYSDDNFVNLFSNIKNTANGQYNDPVNLFLNTDKPKNKDVVLFESVCDLFISDIGVKSALLSYSDDRKIEINKNVRSLFNLLTTDTDDKRVLEIRENVKDQLDAYANDNED